MACRSNETGKVEFYCMYACTYICMYVRMCVCIYVRKNVCANVCTYVYIICFFIRIQATSPVPRIGEVQKANLETAHSIYYSAFKFDEGIP